MRTKDGNRPGTTELKNGRKQGHWIWFVFPQLKGLGKAGWRITTRIASRAEAEAYMKHPVLGQRLIECTELVNRSRAVPLRTFSAK